MKQKYRKYTPEYMEHLRDITTIPHPLFWKPHVLNHWNKHLIRPHPIFHPGLNLNISMAYEDIRWLKRMERKR